MCVAWNRASRRSVPESLTPVIKSERCWQLSSTFPLKAMHKKTSTKKVTHEKRLIDIYKWNKKSVAPYVLYMFLYIVYYLKKKKKLGFSPNK